MAVFQVLVSVPDVDIAEEMVKVNSFMPMKMGDNELKMTQVKQSISLSTPVRHTSSALFVSPLRCLR